MYKFINIFLYENEKMKVTLNLSQGNFLLLPQEQHQMPRFKV